MKNINIIFGSTGGNTEITCIKVGNLLEIEGYNVSINSVLSVKPKTLTSNDITILACPTYGHGILERNFAPFQEIIKNIDLKRNKFAIIGLGDFKYDIDYHYESIKILEETITNSNGAIIIEPLRILKSPYRYMGNLMNKWVEDLTDKINE